MSGPIVLKLPVRRATPTGPNAGQGGSQVAGRIHGRATANERLDAEERSGPDALASEQARAEGNGAQTIGLHTC